MSDNQEKKSLTIAEQVFDIVCLAASYGLLFLLPQKVGFFFYLIFGISAFLFCIGFFRLGFIFDAPADARGTIITSLFMTLYGIAANLAGLYVICRDQGSGRSIMIATLLLIEALVMFSIAENGAKEAKTKWIISVLFRIAAVLGILFGVAFAIWKSLSMPSVMVGTMLLIEGICLWKMGSGKDPYNQLTPEIQAVPGMQTPIEQLKQDFAGVKTQLGYPWIGNVKTIKQDALIYGPSEDGFFVYGYYHFGQFYVSGSANPLFPHPEDAQAHMLPEIPDSNGILLVNEDLPEAYANMFARYAKTGNAQWSTDLSKRGE